MDCMIKCHEHHTLISRISRVCEEKEYGDAIMKSMINNYYFSAFCEAILESSTS